MVIYRLRNLVNGKVYIGQTVNSKKRLQIHRSSVIRGSRQAIHCAIRKYGWDKFQFEVLYQAKCLEEMNAMETFFIILHQSHIPENGYNRSLGGHKRENAGQVPWNKGLCGAQVAWNKNKKMSDAFRAKCRTRGMEKARIAKSRIIKWTPERRAEISARFSGVGNPFFGRKHSSETKKKMSSAKRQLTYTPQLEAR